MVFRTDVCNARRTPEPAEPLGSDVRPVVVACANSADGEKSRSPTILGLKLPTEIAPPLQPSLSDFDQTRQFHQS